MNKLILVGVSLLCASLFALPGKGEATSTYYWHTSVGGCTPIDDGIQGNRYNILNGGGLIKHQSGSTSDIDTTCPINFTRHASTSTMYLKLTFEDDDQSDTNKIVAYVNKYSKSTGTLSVVCSLTTPSTAGTSSWETKTSGSCGTIADDSDHDSNIYWVRVVLIRGSTSDNLSAQAVELQDSST